jgi:hypothetical protein
MPRPVARLCRRLAGRLFTGFVAEIAPRLTI